MTYHADVHYEDGSFWAQVRELPGCFASGHDMEELREAINEAVDMCLPGWEKLLNLILGRAPQVELERELVA
jgi:Uncharacterised protein family (UPF0150).